MVFCSRVMSKNLVFFLLCFATCSAVHAQRLGVSHSTISSSGGSWHTGKSYVRSTIGQSGSGSVFLSKRLMVRHGFQQPSFSHGFPSPSLRILDFKLFPNPNKGVFRMQVELNFNTSYRFDLVTVQGQTVASYFGHSGEELLIALDRISAPGIYIGRLLGPKSELLRSVRIMVL